MSSIIAVWSVAGSLDSGRFTSPTEVRRALLDACDRAWSDLPPAESAERYAAAAPALNSWTLRELLAGLDLFGVARFSQPGLLVCVAQG